MSRRNVSLLLITLPIMFSGCAVKTGIVTPPAQLVTPTTPLQWTIVYTASLARSNKLVESTANEIKSTGHLNASQAASITAACDQVDKLIESIKVITNTSTEATWDADSTRISNLLKRTSITIPASTHQTVTQVREPLNQAVATLNASLLLLRQHMEMTGLQAHNKGVYSKGREN